MKNYDLFNKIKVTSNELRFQIIELTQDKELSISELSSQLGLSYTSCADYVTILYNAKVVDKTKSGKEVLIKSLIKIKDNKIEF